jgi:hypothetical protein
MIQSYRMLHTARLTHSQISLRNQNEIRKYFKALIIDIGQVELGKRPKDKTPRETISLLLLWSRKKYVFFQNSVYQRSVTSFIKISTALS